jgi:hypothetical protein
MNQFRFGEAGVVTVQDDESLDGAAGVTTSDTDPLQRKRKRVRYLAGQAGFDFQDYDANGDGRVETHELTIIGVDTDSENAGQYNVPGCTSVGGVSVCSGVAMAGHR